MSMEPRTSRIWLWQSMPRGEKTRLIYISTDYVFDGLKRIVHATGTDDCMWCESAIVSAMGQQTPVYPIAPAEADRRAARPSDSVLSNCMLKQSGMTLPHWGDSLVQFVKSAAASPAI
jgi:dTDP-4-dehydrorhamnose reductase